MRTSRKHYGTDTRRHAHTRPAGKPHRVPWPIATTREATGEVGRTAHSGQLAQLEALLFLSGEPITAEKCAEILGLPNAGAAVAEIEKLRQFYATEGSAFTVDALGGGYQLRTHAAMAPWLVRLKRMPAHHQLPATLLETLTVIAYKQPLTRADVEAIRGVACAESIKLLMGKGLVRTAGRHPSLGRPQLYATTKRFLQTFGLDTLAELPDSSGR